MDENTKNNLEIWNRNKLYNPFTKRKIKLNGKTYIKLKNLYEELFTQNLNDYKYFRKNKIDPILLEQVDPDKSFSYKYKWNPYSGEKLNEIDENGPLFFDCNSLINYFYVNRLNNLWIPSHNEGEFIVEGHFGDALGKYPDFNIKGRGTHKQWHLFRLPIIDCYVPKNNSLKYITMGPILSDKDLKKIYKLSNKNIYKKTYKKKIPNLLKLKKIYDKAIDPFKQYDNLNLEKNEIELIKFDLNTSAVKELINI